MKSSTLEALINDWNDGKDYAVIDGIVYGMFIDGIWSINNDAPLWEQKVEFIVLPITGWNSNNE